MTAISVFVYGSLKEGFPNYEHYAHILGPRLGAFRTSEPRPLIIPNDPACTNPNCSLKHRMAALVDDVLSTSFLVRGDLFSVTEKELAAIDKLEGYDPSDPGGSEYRRAVISVDPVNGTSAVRSKAWAFFIGDPSQFLALLKCGKAHAVQEYTREMSLGEKKDCCIMDPNHPSDQHDIIELATCSSSLATTATGTCDDVPRPLL